MVHRQRGMREWRVQNEYLAPLSLSVSLALTTKTNTIKIAGVCMRVTTPNPMQYESSNPIQ